MTKSHKQGPRPHFESGWANTSEVFENKILKGPLFSKFSKSGWAVVVFKNCHQCYLTS